MKISVVIRYKDEDAIADIDHNTVCFESLLNLLRAAFGKDCISAFEYMDEDGDTITVRSNKEMPVFLMHLLEVMATGAKAVINARSADDRHSIRDLSLSLATDFTDFMCTSHPSGVSASDSRFVDTTLSSGGSNGNGHTNVADYACDVSNFNVTFKATHDASPSSMVGGEMLTDSFDWRQSDGTPFQMAADWQLDGSRGSSSEGSSETFSFDSLHMIKEIGQGNFGTVYQATIVGSNCQLAVKSIRLDVSEQTQKQISSEFEILHKCQSNFIIRFYGSFFTEGLINLCMEYMDGGSLSNHGVISNEKILGSVVYCVTHGLRYLWSIRILHRDVKPSNILVSSIGDIKLCDFGVSTQLVRSIAQTFVGTVAYMAPERLRGEQYNELADVWSLGVSIFELATGRLPYDQDVRGTGGNGYNFSMQLVYQLAAQNPISLQQFSTGRSFSTELVDFVDSCVQRDGKKRLQPLVLHAHAFVVSHGDMATNREAVAQWLHSSKCANLSCS